MNAAGIHSFTVHFLFREDFRSKEREGEGREGEKEKENFIITINISIFSILASKLLVLWIKTKEKKSLENLRK